VLAKWHDKRFGAVYCDRLGDGSNALTAIKAILNQMRRDLSVLGS